MSSVASSAAANPTGGASCSTTDFTQFPIQDVLCAVGSIQGIPSNYSDIMKGCCKEAPVESFANDCGLYCLAYQQSVADLQKCFQEDGINAAQIFCNGTQTATATGKPDSSNPTSTGSGSGSSESTGAAPAMAPVQSISKAGLGMLAILFVSAAFGALL